MYLADIVLYALFGLVLAVIGVFTKDALIPAFIFCLAFLLRMFKDGLVEIRV
ncbi:hypothetical protein HY993_00830 [Candidatus Micrarchaeota archaeon]|nr:hypothetical protein [Candidatus Micrarchaeota archaeon]